jgi:hypothetical protein
MSSQQRRNPAPIACAIIKAPPSELAFVMRREAFATFVCVASIQ